MAIRDLYVFEELENIAVDLVIDELEKQLQSKSMLEGLSQEQVLDMTACALNLVRPMYRANLLGRVYVSAFHDQYKQDIEASVQQAIQRILFEPN